MLYWVEKTISRKRKFVLQGEGRGKYSSPHLVKYFWDQNHPEIGRCDLYWIYFLFFIYLDASRVEKLEESNCMVISIGTSRFGELENKTLLSHF